MICNFKKLGEERPLYNKKAGMHSSFPAFFMMATGCHDLLVPPASSGKIPKGR